MLSCNGLDMSVNVKFSYLHFHKTIFVRNTAVMNFDFKSNTAQHFCSLFIVFLSDTFEYLYNHMPVLFDYIVVVDIKKNYIPYQLLLI